MTESRSLILSQMCASKFSCFLMSDRLLGGYIGMMPHPERCSEDVLGGHDGRLIFESMLEALGEKQMVGA